MVLCAFDIVCIVHIGLCCPLAAPGAPGTCGCRPQEMPPCPLSPAATCPTYTSSPDFTQTCAFVSPGGTFTHHDFTQTQLISDITNQLLDMPIFWVWHLLRKVTTRLWQLTSSLDIYTSVHFTELFYGYRLTWACTCTMGACRSMSCVFVENWLGPVYMIHNSVSGLCTVIECDLNQCQCVVV